MTTDGRTALCHCQREQPALGILGLDMASLLKTGSVFLKKNWRIGGGAGGGATPPDPPLQTVASVAIG